MPTSFPQRAGQANKNLQDFDTTCRTMHLITVHDVYIYICYNINNESCYIEQYMHIYLLQMILNRSANFQSEVELLQLTRGRKAHSKNYGYKGHYYYYCADTIRAQRCAMLRSQCSARRCAALRCVTSRSYELL